ncbi:alanyl-tRNA editing protein Aarsd1-like [Corticium candelabrum]|uniref:alanyl-tRNA editing protein Aarsd1-like n=1 Tax=Corticium candelabrum TaxID=121492 RepID=UPI002E260337|nr:alanyl-tRNA editing protein Aarsd1-like [Corticium candelabrum]
MAFACQRDSYAKELVTTVKSCTSAKIDGKLDGYEVILGDTVLFPEGGGQPDDRGTIDEVFVERVIRRGGEAVHYTTKPLEVGKEVKLKVDWKRRFDHMQQHTGQHLVTALADNKYGFKTVSWCLGPQKSFIELDCTKMSQQQIDDLEVVVNECIRAQTPVTPHVLQVGSPELEEVRSRGLPDDHVGPVRVIEIQGIDSNMCCGTHLSNLSHLQSIKLLHTENKRGHVLLYFVAGQRVLDYLNRTVNNERNLSKLLSCGPEDHVECVERLQKAQKSSAKVTRSYLREIAQLIVYNHLHNESRDPVACIHRDDGDMEFMNSVANELAPQGIVCLITVGPEKGAGQFLLAGSEDIISSLGPKVAEILDGKGGGRKGRYQGKANGLRGREKAEALIREAMENKTVE